MQREGASITGAEGEGVTTTKQIACTGLAAQWCPNCGDCKCRTLDNGERSLSDDECPLHGQPSIHAQDADDDSRRKRAKELRFTLLGAAHNWRACWRPEDDGDRGRHWNRLIGALDELERMAIEGGATNAADS